MSANHKRISDKQVAALKYLIYKSRYGSMFLKQILFLLINGSANLTKDVYFTFGQGSEYRNEEVSGHAQTMLGMLVSNQTTLLNDLLTLAGRNYKFSIDYGCYDNQGKFSDLVAAKPTIVYTIWLSREYHGKNCQPTKIEASREEIESIQIFKTGLYPELESTCSACDTQNHEPPRHLAQTK